MYRSPQCHILVSLCHGVPAELGVNATDLFDRYLYDSEYDDLIEGDLPNLEVSRVVLEQSIQVGDLLTTSNMD